MKKDGMNSFSRTKTLNVKQQKSKIYSDDHQRENRGMMSCQDSEVDISNYSIPKLDPVNSKQTANREMRGSCQNLFSSSINVKNN